MLFDDEEGYEFEQIVEVDKRVVRIVLPMPKEAIAHIKALGVKDEKLTGKDARRKIIKYLFGTTAGICMQAGVPALNDVLHNLCEQVLGGLDGE